MLLVNRQEIGDAAFARLARDGAVHDVLGGWALPADVRSTRALRAFMLSEIVPPHAWLTGLGALWLEGLAPPPTRLDLAGGRGTFRVVPAPGSPPLVLHTGPSVGLPDGGSPRVATMARACVEALWHSPAATALPASYAALRAGATTIPRMRTILRELGRHRRGVGRVSSLVEALASVPPQQISRAGSR